MPLRKKLFTNAKKKRITLQTPSSSEPLTQIHNSYTQVFLIVSSFKHFPARAKIDLLLTSHESGLTRWAIQIPLVIHIWAATCDFKQSGILTWIDSYKHVQPPFKLKISKWCSLSSLTVIEYSSDNQRLWSDCTYAQADLRLCWSHIPHCWKSHAAAHFLNGEPKFRLNSTAHLDVQ